MGLYAFCWWFCCIGEKLKDSNRRSRQVSRVSVCLSVPPPVCLFPQFVCPSDFPFILIAANLPSRPPVHSSVFVCLSARRSTLRLPVCLPVCPPSVCPSVHLSSARLSSRLSAEVCSGDDFVAKCGLNRVIVMTSAHYGRMRRGRCIEAGEELHYCQVSRPVARVSTIC